MKPIEHKKEELQKKVLKLFNQYCGVVDEEAEEESKTGSNANGENKEFNFGAIADLSRHTVFKEKEQKQVKIFGEDILMALFEKIVDLDKEVLKNKLGDFLQNLIEKSTINPEGWKKSVQ